MWFRALARVLKILFNGTLANYIFLSEFLKFVDEFATFIRYTHHCFGLIKHKDFRTQCD